MGAVHSTSFRNSCFYPHNIFMFGEMLRISSDFDVRQAGVYNGDEVVFFFFFKLGTGMKFVFERVQLFGL